MFCVGTAASSMSLILIHQLEDKLKAHDLYLSFLKNVDLWSRVRTGRTKIISYAALVRLC